MIRRVLWKPQIREMYPGAALLAAIVFGLLKGWGR